MDAVKISIVSRGPGKGRKEYLQVKYRGHLRKRKNFSI
jgi:hypothetical protein